MILSVSDRCARLVDSYYGSLGTWGGDCRFSGLTLTLFGGWLRQGSFSCDENQKVYSLKHASSPSGRAWGCETIAEWLNGLTSEREVASSSLGKILWGVSG